MALSLPVNQDLFGKPPKKKRRPRRSHLQKICEDFTLSILEGHPSTSMCFVVSIALEGWLNFSEGLDCKAVEGRVGIHNHWWIELRDGRIIDATADQFNGSGHPDMPLVYIGEMPLWYAINPLGEFFRGGRHA